MTNLLSRLSLLTPLLLAGCAIGPSRPSQTPMPTGPAGPAVALHAQQDRQPWPGREPNGLQIFTDHFHLYTTTRHPYLLETMPAFLEAAHRNHVALTGLGDEPAGKKMIVYLMASRPEWVALTTKRLGEQAAPYLRIQSGGYMLDGICVFWDIGAMRTFRVASHEGLHQFFHHRLRQRPPVWLEEGLCTLAEGFRIDGADAIFDPAENGERFSSMRAGLGQAAWIPLDKLLVMDAGEAIAGTSTAAVQYYGQLWSLCLYLRSRPDYRAGITRLLADARAGRLHQAAGVPESLLSQGRSRQVNRATALKIFQHYFTSDLSTFELDYIAFSKALAKFR